MKTTHVLLAAQKYHNVTDVSEVDLGMCLYTKYIPNTFGSSG